MSCSLETPFVGAEMRITFLHKLSPPPFRLWACGWAALLLISAIMLPAPASAWHVDNAPLRYELSLEDAPTHPSAGYFVSLPDGGILPGPFPVTHVKTPDGRPVESYLLWHNPESGMGVVFADPGIAGRRVFVYVSGAANYVLWNPRTGLTPSSILVSAPGSDRMADARALAELGSVGRNVRYWNYVGPGRAPVGIGGDLAGRERPGVFYLLAHLVSHDPGRTWIAPFTRDGETEVLINGERIVPRKRIDKWGGTGQWADIDDGLQRLEVFQTASGTGGYTGGRGGLMFLTWRTPNATMQELGGVRSEAVPMSGTSRMETRVLRENELARSGSAVLEDARARDGGPVALIEARARHTFWVGGETPLLLYELSAVQSGNPTDTEYEWRFEDGTELEGAVVEWLLPGLREHRIELAARAQGGESKTELTFHAFARTGTSLNNPGHREAYRAALLGMLRAHAESPEIVERWDRAYWNNLLRCLDFGGGYAILREMFDNYSKAMSARLSRAQVVALQEMFLDAASGIDPNEALRWVEVFRDEAYDEYRRKHLAVRQAEIYAHYLDDLESARRILTPLARNEDAAGQLARVRLGDIAFMEGDLNLATRYYANVQRLVRRERAMREGVYDALSDTATEPLPVEERTGPVPIAERLSAERERFMEAAARYRRDPAAGPASVAERLSVDRERFMEAAALHSRDPMEDEMAPPASGSWKLGALLETSASENVGKLITDGHLFEARQMLDAWEREFPLSKLGGDYILQESRLYREAGDSRRAFGMLRAYCDQVDASSYLPDAAKLLMKCMVDLEIPPEEIRDYGRKLRDRLEFHPVSKELEFMAEYGR